MKRFTISTRWLICAVFILAVVFGLFKPAYEVHREADLHVHEWVERKVGGRVDYLSGLASPPFWPRYRNRLLGRPWKGSPFCSDGGKRLAEACERNHPELIGDGLGLGNLIKKNPAMKILVNRSNR